MKRRLTTASICLALAGCFEIKPDPAEFCFDIHKTNLMDPITAVIENSYVEGDRITVLYRAKNVYGTYLPGTFKCKLFSDGTVDQYGTKLEELQAAKSD